MEVKVDHRRIGNGWVYLGQYHLTTSGYVEITNYTRNLSDADGKHVVIADAIRFGNGMGNVNRGGGTSAATRRGSRPLLGRRQSRRTRRAGLRCLRQPDQDTNVGTPPRTSAV